MLEKIKNLQVKKEQNIQNLNELEVLMQATESANEVSRKIKLLDTEKQSLKECLQIIAYYRRFQDNLSFDGLQKEFLENASFITVEKASILKTLGEIARKDDTEAHSQTSASILKLVVSFEEKVKTSFL